jgi:ABC-type transport system substrate-binding protein/class 3 adenylate cyclase
MEATGGERRQVAVLVADVADSTAIGERLGPERSKFLFDEVVRLLGEQVRRYGGTVAQLTGDGVYALFGAPVAHEDDSERAVRAALAIRDTLADYARDVEEAFGVALSARVAVNSGPVLLVEGEMPDDARYNALGDTVNVAARLQAAAAGGIVVGPATARQVERRFELEALGELELKGKSLPVAAFLVVGEREAEARPAERPLVGRDVELAMLERTLEELLEGRGSIVAITGEPGIGKTRLVAEAVKRYGDSVRFLEGHAVSYAETIPYWPFRELVRRWLGLGAATPEARLRLELKAELARALGDGAEDVYPFIAGMLGLALEPDTAERLRHLSRDSVQQQTIDGISDLVRALARETPVALVLEDLHWADEATLELLDELLEVPDEEAVALLLLYRSEREHASWQLGQRARQRFPHRYRELELAALDPEACRTLGGNAAGGELPQPLAALLTDRAGGNPFFIEEVLRDLVERGVLEREDGRVRIADSAEPMVPALVQEALQARLDRVDPQAREVLNAAAVVGRNFAMPLLERVTASERLLPALSELQRLDLVVEERRRPVAEYRFRHGLVQEVAYTSLVGPKRRDLHRTIGHALEELHAEAPAAAYGLLARHFSEADEPERAIEYLLKAGDAARALYANEEALEHYTKALAFMERTVDLRARATLLKVALIHHLAFDFERAKVAYDDAFARAAVAPRRLDPTKSIDVLFPSVWDFVPGYANFSHTVWFANHLFRGLVSVDRELSVVPELSERFAVSDDGRVYRFRLRDDSRWSDGHAVTAEDYVDAFRTSREAGLPVSHLLEDVEEARAIDHRTLELRVHEPRNFFLYILAAHAGYPWPRHRVEQLGESWRDPTTLIGNGPFVLTEFDDRHAVLAANPHWPGPRGNVREARFNLLNRDDEKLGAWRQGKGDLTWVFGPPSLADEPDTVAALNPHLGSGYVAYRANAAPFDDERVRKAFSHAVDRDRLLGRVPCVDQPAGRGGLIPPPMPGHSHRAGPEHDLELARRLLAEAGYPDGSDLPEIALVVPDYLGGGRPHDIARDLAEQWAQLGARVRTTIVETELAFAAVATANASVWGWDADFPDPHSMFGLLGTLPVHRDAEIDALLESARSLRDQGERMRAYRRADQLLVSERAAILPTSYTRTLLLSRPWIDGFEPSPVLSHGVSLDRVAVRGRHN